MTIKKKLSLGFSLVILISILSSSFVFYQLNKAQSEVHELATNWVPSIKAVGKINDDFLNYIRFLYAFALESDSAAMDRLDQLITDRQQKVEKDRVIYEPLISSPEERKTYEQFVARWQEYQQIVPRIKEAARKNDFAGANREFVKGRLLVNEMGELLQKLVKINEDGASESAAISTEASSYSKISLVIASIISAISGTIIAVAIALSVVRPLRTLEKALGDLVEKGGDLTQEIAIYSKDEVGDLAIVVNAFIANLRTIMAEVIDDAQQVAAASEELTANAEQSAQASNQVAVSVITVADGVNKQSTAAADTLNVVTQMSGGVQQAASNATAVAAIADNTARSALKGSEAVGKVVEQMNEIEKASTNAAEAVNKLSIRSQEIGQIVEDITSIAGQTNLLALNAAIEAARAGEQGRGFAVVAEEVRKLAEQSKEAAKRISGLITEIKKDTDEAVGAMNKGSDEVKTGAIVVQTAGKSFDEIRGLIDNVSSQVTDISAVVQQLAGSSENIVDAMQSITGVSKATATEAESISAATEEQSASVEEIASASMNLAKLAQNLQNAVSKFKV
ncbi:MAG: HAMP domain-containing methyl-accepting chemotaxis protein [Sporomusaceae bacterium]|nr:HAMP domain-containing methyl-accepting chemotaxis protein [Sporomusaceae bacterium]